VTVHRHRGSRHSPEAGAAPDEPATGAASSHPVEAYRLYRNVIKAVARCGQGDSLSDEGLAPVASPMMPAINADSPLPRKDQKVARGSRLV